MDNQKQCLSCGLDIYSQSDHNVCSSVELSVRATFLIAEFYKAVSYRNIYMCAGCTDRLNGVLEDFGIKLL